MNSKLHNIEEYFNEIFEMNKLVEDAVLMIHKIRLDDNSSLYEDTDLEEKYMIKQAEISYDGVEILLNREGMFPSFILKFILKGVKCHYLYEIEYNSQGEVLDDYFEKIE